jgi:NADH:ubiquinone oxidoreductase subunit E
MDVEPVSHRVRLCTGLCCRLTGATDHLRALEERLKIVPGQTTADGRVALEEAPCLSVCSLAPVIEVDGVCHGRVTAAAIARLPVWYRTRPPWPVDVDAANFPRVEAVGATARERLAWLRAQAEARARNRPEWRFLVQGGSCGEALGAGEVLKALRILAAMRGIDAEVLDGACHGLCAAGIVVEIQRAGWPALTFTDLTTDRVPDLLSAVAGEGAPLTRFAGVAWNSEGWRGVTSAFRQPFFAKQRRVIVERCGHVNPVSLDDALLHDGYAALAQVLDEPTADAGAAAEPVSDALVVGADEGIPGLFTDRHLIEGDPHRVLEGLVIAAHAARASLGIIRINGAARLARDRMTRAVAKAQAAGLIGDGILGSAFSFRVEIRQPADGHARDEAPRASVAAMAALPPLIAEGRGKRASPSRSATTLCGLSGPVSRPGIVEVDGAVTLRELLCDVAGGLQDRGPSGRALVVGPSGVSFSSESLDAPVESFVVLSAGTGGVIAIPGDLAATNGLNLAIVDR